MKISSLRTKAHCITYDVVHVIALLKKACVFEVAEILGTSSVAVNCGWVSKLCYIFASYTVGYARKWSTLQGQA